MRKLIMLLLLPMMVAAQIPKRRLLKVSKENSVCVCGTFDIDLTISTVLQTAFRFGKEPLYIFINSPGGYVVTIRPIQHILAMIPNAVVVVAEADSAAALLLARLPNKKVMMDNGILLYHKMFVSGPMDDRTKVVLELENYLLMRDTARLLDMNYVDYKQRITEKNWVLNAQQALDRGIIQEIVELDIDKSLYH